MSQKWLFHNKTSVGVSFSRGNTHLFTIDGDNDFVVRKKLFTNTLSSRGQDVSGTPSQTQSRFFIVEDRVDYSFHKDFYAFGKTGWQTDRAMGMEHDILFHAGLSWVWHKKTNINFEQDLTFIQEVQKISNFRFSTNSELSVYLTKHFGVSIGLTYKLDNQPIVGYKKYDLQTSISATMNF